MKTTAFLLCSLFLMAGTVAGEMIQITSFDANGQLCWTNQETNVWCTVEWASGLSGPWRRDWDDFRNICMTSCQHGVQVPMYYRVLSTTNELPDGVRQYEGTDLEGWEVVVGDGCYNQATEDPVDEDDIETIDYGTHSELRANMEKRGIMAHNITFKRFIDDDAFDYVHECSYDFRLPYLPSTANVGTNAQTLEIAFFIWDGPDTRLDYGMAYQWVLNPWMSEFGDLLCWSDLEGGEWRYIGHLDPDTEWHELELVFDFRRQTTALKIDGNHYPCRFTAITKSPDWGTEIAARLCAEIISLDPGQSNPGALHRAQFRDWTWTWTPYE